MGSHLGARLLYCAKPKFEPEGHPHRPWGCLRTIFELFSEPPNCSAALQDVGDDDGAAHFPKSRRNLASLS